MKAYSSKAIANEFIRLAQDNGKTLTHMQLQKLIYFAHAMSLVIYSQPLVNGGFQAWPFGHVNRDLYLELQGSGKNGITMFLDLDQHEEINQDVEAKEIIKNVYEQMGDKDGWELSKITHQKGAPWSKAFKPGKSNQINDGAIQYFYRGLLH